MNAGCSATISSLSGKHVVGIARYMVLTFTDVANAVKCTTITINGFTVPAGKGLILDLAAGTTVTMSECPIFCATDRNSQ